MRKDAANGFCRISTRALAAVLAVVFILAAAAWGEEEIVRRYSYTERREFAWEEGKPLVVRESGGTIYASGWGKKDIKVKAVKTAYAPRLTLARRNAALLNVAIEAPHDRISIRTVNPTIRTGQMRSYTDYSLNVPREINLDLKTVEGGIYVAGVKGDVAARTASGTISLKGISGAATAETETGELVLTDCDNLRFAKAASAAISFSITGKEPGPAGAPPGKGPKETGGPPAKTLAADAELRNERGTISITFPEDTPLILDVTAPAGKIEAAEAKVTVSAEAGDDSGSDGDSLENRKYYSGGGGGARITVYTAAGEVIIKTTPRADERDIREKNYIVR